MPGRPSARSSRSSASAISRKSSTQALKSRSSTAARASSTAAIPDEGPPTTLRTQICTIFADAQRSNANQRKLVIGLRKIQESCCYEPVKPAKQQRQEDYGEELFNTEIGRCVLRVLTVKKSELVGDRIVRFVGLFLRYASDKDNAIARSLDPDATEALPETPTTRLTSHVVTLLLQCLAAKDKTVRFRATQLIAHIVNTVDSIDEELFPQVRSNLLKRVRDKESAVRVQAVLGLGPLASEAGQDEDEDDLDDEGAGGILEKLVDVLQNDPSAEVRRSVLINLPFTPETLPFLLERARDADSATRRALYARVLPALGDFRHLSLTHRDKLLRWGLRDRDEHVRKAAARIFRECWIEFCAAGTGQSTNDGNEDGATAVQEPGKVAKPNYDALLELLERIDVVNTAREGGIGLEAMKEFWDGRPDYRDFITFDDAFWDALTPESAVIARTFNDYCREAGEGHLQGTADDRMPEVTKFAFILQKQIGSLIEMVEKVEKEESAEAEEDLVQLESVVEQLLNFALTLDYTDEIGRRKMFSVMRDSLAQPLLPEECTKLVVEVLRIVCGYTPSGERDFCSIVIEAISDVHDTIAGDDVTSQEVGDGDEEDDDASFHSAKSEVDGDSTPTKARKSNKPSVKDESEDSEIAAQKAIQNIMVNMKCVHIAQCMLQNVQCALEDNSHLVTMVDSLVLPAARSYEAPIRERGLICLGLCCLLSKNLATENLPLFLHCFSKGNETLQTIALEIISDILTTHPSLLVSKPVSASSSELEPNAFQKPAHKAFARALRSDDPGVQATGCLALCKLMLAGIITEPELLRMLVVAYFDPDTQDNAALRQALTYFLPAYCHSRRENMARMASVATAVVRALVGRSEELDEEDEMVGLGVVAAQLVDWTDERKLVGADGVGSQDRAKKEENADVDADVHLVLAQELLEKVMSTGCSKEEKKVYISMLSKLHISPSLSPSSTAALRDVALLVEESLDSKVATEATTRNALTKLQTSLGKALADAGAGVGSNDVTEVGCEQRSSEARSSPSQKQENDEPTLQDEHQGQQPKDEGQDTQQGLEEDFTQMEAEPDAEGTILTQMGDEETVIG